MLVFPFNFVAKVIKTALRIAYVNRNAAYYAISCIFVFALTYWLMGVEKHFDTPEYIEAKRKNSFFNSLYIATLAQSNAMPDSTPKTTAARALFMFQVSLGWMWFLLFSNMDGK